jgi:hypothetical protein
LILNFDIAKNKYIWEAFSSCIRQFFASVAGAYLSKHLRVPTVRAGNLTINPTILNYDDSLLKLNGTAHLCVILT